MWPAATAARCCHTLRDVAARCATLQHVARTRRRATLHPVCLSAGGCPGGAACRELLCSASSMTISQVPLSPTSTRDAYRTDAARPPRTPLGRAARRRAGFRSGGAGCPRLHPAPFTSPYSHKKHYRNRIAHARARTHKLTHTDTDTHTRVHARTHVIVSHWPPVRFGGRCVVANQRPVYYSEPTAGAL